MSLWPFPPVDEVIEILEWKTDVLSARSAEQRFRLRERPRRQWSFSHIFDAESQSSARSIIRGASSFQVPDWIRRVYSGSISAGSSVAITMDTTGFGLSAGASVVLWAGILNNEICTIESVSPTGFVLEYVATARTASIYRIDNAHAATSLDITRQGGHIQRASIMFEAPAVDIYAASTYAQYRSHDVLPIMPTITNRGTLDEGIMWPREVFDNGTGLVSTTATRDIPDNAFMMRWHVFTQTEIQSLRAWIASRYGRWLAFWQSSWQRDLVAAADVGSSSTTLRVFCPTGATSLGRTTFDIEVISSGGSYFRRVTNVSAGPLVSGRNTFDLTIDSAFGVAILAISISRISYLRCSRFDADRIELLHRPSEGLAVAIPCIEVPVP